MTEIKPPTNCPSCDSVLVWENHILYCKNPECCSKLSKKIEHFARSMKIKGLGPRSISKLGFSSINDIYSVDVEYLTEQLGSVKLANKLRSEINNSKNAPLNQLLPAFSIPLIGRSASEKLSFVCENIFEIDEDTCKTAGLGPKATENLLNWLNVEFINYADLPFSYSFDRNVSKASAIAVCITGKLSSFKTKAEAQQALEAVGYTVKSGLTKDVKVLVNESGIESAKTKKARESGIAIVTNLIDFIGENT